jgi:hypothetical protein
MKANAEAKIYKSQETIDEGMNLACNSTIGYPKGQ